MFRLERSRFFFCAFDARPKCRGLVTAIILEEATVLVQAPKKRARGARRSGEERRRRDERDKVFGMIVSAHPHRGNANAQVFEFG